jgi:hypothetical protein
MYTVNDTRLATLKEAKDWAEKLSWETAKSVDIICPDGKRITVNIG